MAVRKNAKHLSAAERENLVRAFVSMHADIVNPTAPAADRYSKWDEYVAVHRLIQNVNTPSGNVGVNFGHGGTGAYGFLPWHRYFLLQLEQQLQSYVAGVTLPYWDWTDPTVSLFTDTFLGPDGDIANGSEVRRGYFAADAPGTGTNPTPAPPWWPAGLTGWRLHTAFGSSAGPLRRRLSSASSLPSVASIRSAMDKTTYHAFQVAVEAGSGTSPFHGLHNSLHGWFGSGSHMSSVIVSPFDPTFYLHHCNIDRLWAMWQMDGHATDYPTSGGDDEHHLNDPMYPWVGTTAGYTSNYAFPPITMPDFSALGVQTAADVLDHRALGYSYDTQVVIGVSLDRTGSMTGLTPDPMTSGAPDVTKWVAATRGVSAFLQDCETAYAAVEAYVVAGVETFRSLFGNEFTPVFAGTPYGLVKAGGGYSAAGFDSAIATQSPGGNTPLADALVNAHASLVQPPFGTLPAGEQRYLAILTDGMLTSGSPLSSVPDGSLTDTAVFAMGFGTGADVDYATIQELTDKGDQVLANQVFHGENAGTIDKFYSQALAAALGFTPVTDPVLELFAGEHTHLSFEMTSADDAFFLTAQGLDYSTEDWGYQLIAPDGRTVYVQGVAAHAHGHGHGHGGHGPLPAVSTTFRNGRLSVFVNRDNAGRESWVGSWTLLVSWRAAELDAMVMLDVGDLMVPVSAGPVRGPRWVRLLQTRADRVAVRNVVATPRHRLDVRPAATSRRTEEACATVVNVYARSRLRTALVPRVKNKAGTLTFDVVVDTVDGAADGIRAIARLLAPTRQLAAANRKAATAKPGKRTRRLDGSPDGRDVDSATALAVAEERDPRIGELRDEEAEVVSHGGTPHVHVTDAREPGAYHLGVYVDGTYCACCAATADGGHDHGGGEHHSAEGGHGGHGHDGHGDGGGDCGNHRPERFTRLLTASAAVPDPAFARPERATGGSEKDPRAGGRAEDGKRGPKR